MSTFAQDHVSLVKRLFSRSSDLNYKFCFPLIVDGAIAPDLTLLYLLRLTISNALPVALVDRSLPGHVVMILALLA
jgi:hypothetical protein